MQSGRRKSTISNITNTKKHIKHFYKRLHELDLVAQAMVQAGEAVTKDNIAEKASNYIERELDTMEQNILLSKLTQVYDKLGIKTVKQSE